MGAKITFDNKEVTLNSEVIILAVKPHIVPVALNDIKPVFNESNLLISVAGGVPIKNMEQALPKNSRIIRAMPNTPALVRQGASVFVRGSSASDQDAQTVINLFKSVGTCEEVPEYLLDGITGLSGSGPAYRRDAKTYTAEPSRRKETTGMSGTPPWGTRHSSVPQVLGSL
ncbi:hypothetical protein M8J76_017158 [Diaphorina citri]|nr:hypothetical protein M8J76_017158 [Diaphorina citri]